MADRKPKPAIQLRFPNDGTETLKVKLVERQADETFKTLSEQGFSVTEWPRNIRLAAEIHGYGDILGKRVSTIKEGREKFETICNVLVPKMAEGIWTDGRGASIEQRAIANITKNKIATVKEWERTRPEEWKKALEAPKIKEEIQRLKEAEAESGGGMDLSDLTG